MRNNIKNDWSVIPGRYQYSDAHQFDFRKAPSKKEVYQFSTDPCEEDPNGEFTEWTISSLQFSRFEKWIDFKINGLRQRLHGKPAMNGSTVESTVLEEGDIFSGSGQRRITASFEGLNIFRVKKYISAIKKAGYFQFISHPKLLSRHDLKMIKRLFAALKNDEDIQTDFRKR